MAEKRVVVASANPVKAQAALDGFSRLFPGDSFAIQPLAVKPRVNRQPMSDAETLQGAYWRAVDARQAVPGADFWVGLEGGVEEDGSEMRSYSWVVVVDNDRCGKGRSASFVLPPAIAALVRAGHELGEADDIIFGRQNSKQQDGAIGLLTENVIDRAALYEMAVIMALLPFKNPALYP